PLSSLSSLSSLLPHPTPPHLPSNARHLRLASINAPVPSAPGLELYPRCYALRLRLPSIIATKPDCSTSSPAQSEPPIPPVCKRERLPLTLYHLSYNHSLSFLLQGPKPTFFESTAEPQSIKRTRLFLFISLSTLSPLFFTLSSFYVLALVCFFCLSSLSLSLSLFSTPSFLVTYLPSLSLSLSLPPTPTLTLTHSHSLHHDQHLHILSHVNYLQQQQQHQQQEEPSLLLDSPLQQLKVNAQELDCSFLSPLYGSILDELDGGRDVARAP
ncbi:MAG: hypothetical protein J3Q66DRAFT_39693, partial [Benniella sp.]